MALCLGLVSACGSGGGDSGYVNDGAAGPDRGAPTAPVPPEDKVSLHPLETQSPSTSDSPADESGEGRDTDESGEEEAGASETSGQGGEAGGSGSGSPSSGSQGASGGSSESPAPSDPGSPAKLSVGDHTRAPGDERRCERVTFSVHNTGGSPVTSGTVTFGTHIFGLLGIDWGTVETSQQLRTPIAAGERADQSYTVCLERSRVPIGRRIETQDVNVSWE